MKKSFQTKQFLMMLALFDVNCDKKLKNISSVKFAYSLRKNLLT